MRNGNRGSLTSITRARARSHRRGQPPLAGQPLDISRLHAGRLSLRSDESDAPRRLGELSLKTRVYKVCLVGKVRGCDFSEKTPPLMTRLAHSWSADKRKDAGRVSGGRKVGEAAVRAQRLGDGEGLWPVSYRLHSELELQNTVQLFPLSAAMICQ